MKKAGLIGFLVLLNSCSSKYEALEKLNWLNGLWESETHGKKIFEKWEKQDDSTFLGASYYIQERDTLVRESMTIAIRNEVLFFQTIVDPNDSLAEETRFDMLSLKKDQVIFENLLHDFPQRIVYGRVGQDSLVAFIDGNYKGEYNRINFPMKRVK